MNKNSLATAMMVFLVATTAKCAVNDYFPTDVVPTQYGSTVLAMYYYDRQSDALYSRGKKIVDSDIDARYIAARFTHGMKVAGYSFSPILVVPWSDIKSEGAFKTILGSKASGVGDVRIGASFWPIEDKNGPFYLSVGAMLFVPNGQYDSKQKLNFGENRYKASFNVASLVALSKNIRAETIFETVMYGDNDDYVGKKLTQRPTYAVTENLRYIAPFGIQPFLHLQQNYGGETSINGVNQKDEMKNLRGGVGVSYIKHGWPMMSIRYGEDLSIRSGIKVSKEIVLRVQHAF